MSNEKDLERDETEDEVVEESDDLPMEPADIDIEVPQEIEDSGSETSVVRYSPLQHYLAEIRKYRFLTNTRKRGTSMPSQNWSWPISRSW